VVSYALENLRSSRLGFSFNDFDRSEG